MTDPVFDRAKRLLDNVDLALDRVNAPACRSFVAPGADAPWDTCCDCPAGEGQAWVAVSRYFPTESFPDPAAGAHRCHPREYAVELVAAVLRCATVVDDAGQPPSAAAVTDDARKVGRDRQALLEAILCGYVGDDADPGEFRLGEWTPLGPLGGCVGGQWTLTVRAPYCPCPDPWP